jgi:hypothetical protein
MQSTLKPEEADPHDVFEIAPGVVLSARADQSSPTLAPDAISHVSAPHAAIVSDAIVPDVMASDAAAPVPPVEPVPLVDTTFRATSVDDILVQSDRTSRERWIGRALMSLFAMFAAVAAAAWQHYGDTAKHTIASWMPPFAVASSPPVQKPALAAQPAASAVQAAAQTSTPTQAPAPAAPPVASAAAVAPAAVSTDMAQLQSMTRDLAAMGQQMEQLKASIAQLRAGQEQMAQQMSRDFARTSEARSSEARPSETRAAEHARIAPLPPRSAAAPLRKPRPALAPAPAAMVSPLPPPAAAVAPLPPPAPSPQATIQPDGESVVRPPLPVR